MTANQPVAPPPSRSRRKVVEPVVSTPSFDNEPAPAAEPVTPVLPEFPTGPTPPRAASTEVAQTEQAPAADPLAGLFVGATRPAAVQQPSTTPSAIAALMGLSRPVDPDNDLDFGPNRYPKYVLAAVTLIARSTGKSRQLIVAEALSGKNPIPDNIMDAAYRELYGIDRPPVR